MLNVPEFTVAEFSRSIKRVVEDAFGYVKIRGEVSGFKCATSGHLYFNLKDEDALLSGVCFKNMAELIDFEIADGLMVVASGRITTFGGRSNYQIVVEKIEIAGVGAILAMIEKRRQKLADEGLFDSAHKKPLPFFPQTIGIITSSTGAVIQDIIHRVEARCPTHLLVYPSAMQGKEASKNIIKAIRYFNKLSKNLQPQVLIIARGGGSFEDLLPFNDEDLVREVFKSKIPIISAVGHETDTTLIDFVADLRAPTPTAAAELATPVFTDLQNQLNNYEQRIYFAIQNFFFDKNLHLDRLQKYIIHPKKSLQNLTAKLSFVEEKFIAIGKNYLEKNQHKLFLANLSILPILHKINFYNQQIENLATSIKSSSFNIIKHEEEKIESLGKLLKTGHYQEILKRGFALIKNARGVIISSLQQVKTKEEIAIEIADGEFYSYVLSCKKNSHEKTKKPTESTQETLI